MPNHDNAEVRRELSQSFWLTLFIDTCSTHPCLKLTSDWLPRFCNFARQSANVAHFRTCSLTGIDERILFDKKSDESLAVL